MSLTDAFKWAGFTGFGSQVVQEAKQLEVNLPVWGDMSSVLDTVPASKSGSPFELSFGTKLLIATSLTLIGLYTVKRLLK